MKSYPWFEDLNLISQDLQTLNERHLKRLVKVLVTFWLQLDWSLARHSSHVIVSSGRDRRP